MHYDPHSQETPEEFQSIEELQEQLYLSGLQMASVLAARLTVEFAAEPDENALKKWYTWTRGLNQLQTFHYGPIRQAMREQKQRGRPVQEPTIHLNGPAPQLRRKPGEKPLNVEADSISPTDPDNQDTHEAVYNHADDDTPESIQATQDPLEPEKTADSPAHDVTPTRPAEFDRINNAAEKVFSPTLTPITSGKFDRIMPNGRRIAHSV